MNGGPLLSRWRFAAVSALSLGLMVAPASSKFAGISGFSIHSPATIVPGSNSKQAIVTGAVTCPSGKVATIGVQIVQPGQKAAHAAGNTRGIQCSTGAALDWKVTASSPAHPMRPGPAMVLAGAWACIPTGACEFAYSSGDIALR